MVEECLGWSLCGVPPFLFREKSRKVGGVCCSGSKRMCIYPKTNICSLKLCKPPATQTTVCKNNCLMFHKKHFFIFLYRWVGIVYIKSRAGLPPFSYFIIQITNNINKITFAIINATIKPPLIF